jgi:hypothetical protein
MNAELDARRHEFVAPRAPAPRALAPRTSGYELAEKSDMS